VGELGGLAKPQTRDGVTLKKKRSKKQEGNQRSVGVKRDGHTRGPFASAMVGKEGRGSISSKGAGHLANRFWAIILPAILRPAVTIRLSTDICKSGRETTDNTHLSTGRKKPDKEENGADPQ